MGLDRFDEGLADDVDALRELIGFFDLVAPLAVGCD
jgi:hypothetical protein